MIGSSKLTEKIILENAFEHKKKKPGLSTNRPSKNWAVVWQATMGKAVLEDFRGKDFAFVANWLRGKGLNKLVLCSI